MQMRLFNRPLVVDDPLALMRIEGMYEDYDAGSRYEGRVKIIGSVGWCKVEVIDTNIPPDASVYIDQVTKEVVVKWDAYTPPVETITRVPNGDFKLGALDWEGMGPDRPVVHTAGYGNNGSDSATYQNMKGIYNIRGAWAPVSDVNKVITLTGYVEQGKSSKRNAAAAMFLEWYDKDRNLIRFDVGNAIDKGGKQAWQRAEVKSAASDPLIALVRPCVSFKRTKQNYPIHVSDVQWDHSYARGYDSDEELFVEVRVTDSVHNTATHRGVIEERSLWFSSRPYPVNQVPEMMTQDITVLGVRIADQPNHTDRIVQYGATVLSATLAESLIKHSQAPVRMQQYTPMILKATNQSALQSFRTIESFQLATPRILTASNLVKLVSSALREEITQRAPTILQGTLV